MIRLGPFHLWFAYANFVYDLPIATSSMICLFPFRLWLAYAHFIYVPPMPILSTVFLISGPLPNSAVFLKFSGVSKKKRVFLALWRHSISHSDGLGRSKIGNFSPRILKNKTKQNKSFLRDEELPLHQFKCRWKKCKTKQITFPGCWKRYFPVGVRQQWILYFPSLLGNKKRGSFLCKSQNRSYFGQQRRKKRYSDEGLPHLAVCVRARAKRCHFSWTVTKTNKKKREKKRRNQHLSIAT